MGPRWRGSGGRAAAAAAAPPPAAGAARAKKRTRQHHVHNPGANGRKRNRPPLSECPPPLTCAGTAPSGLDWELLGCLGPTAAAAGAGALARLAAVGGHAEFGTAELR
eukprot:6232377-Pyramimonas_sp.AAC.1